MKDSVTWIIPVAAPPATAGLAGHHPLGTSGLRLGILDNAKGNADHLLGMIIDGVRAQLPVVSVVSLRKPGPASGATAGILDRLAAEADFVVSAMAD